MQLFSNFLTWILMFVWCMLTRFSHSKVICHLIVFKKKVRIELLWKRKCCTDEEKNQIKKVIRKDTFFKIFPLPSFLKEINYTRMQRKQRSVSKWYSRAPVLALIAFSEETLHVSNINSAITIDEKNIHCIYAKCFVTSCFDIKYPQFPSPQVYNHKSYHLQVPIMISRF